MKLLRLSFLCLIAWGCLFLVPVVKAEEEDDDDHHHEDEEDHLEESGVELALELYDLDGDQGLNEKEVEMMIYNLTSGEPSACASAHAVLNASGIPEDGVAKNESEVQAVLSNLMPCVIQLTCAADFQITTSAGETYSCSNNQMEDHDDHHDEEDEDHDDHDHDHDRLRRTLADDHDDHDDHGHGEEEHEDEEISLVAGHDVELVCSPVSHEEEESPEITGKTWGMAILAGIIGAVVSLVGAFLILCFKDKFEHEFVNDMLAFAIGVLISAVFIHMLPEAVEFHGQYDWRVGTLFILGLFVAFTVELLSQAFGGAHHNYMHQEHQQSAEKTPRVARQTTEEAQGNGTEQDDEFAIKDQVREGESTENGQPPKAKEIDESVEEGGGTDGNQLDYALISNVVVGDGIHNLTDGFLIGIAFALCQDSNLGWIVTAAVLCHEIPQELADFVILVRAGLTPAKALLWNFLSSLMMILGIIIVLAASANLSNSGQGLLLAFGAGFLAFIALADLVPTVVNEGSRNRKLLRLFIVACAAILIGILTLWHPHCETDGVHAHDEAHAH